MCVKILTAPDTRRRPSLDPKRVCSYSEHNPSGISIIAVDVYSGVIQMVLNYPNEVAIVAYTIRVI